MDEKPKNLWKKVDHSKYQRHVTISTIDSTIESENVDERIVYIEDLEKRRQAYGICGECKEPGTGADWCQTCNAKRFKDNFKNWTSGNKHIDEFIQQSQLNAVYNFNCLEWIPFEKFQNVTYIAEGGFGKIYSAEWPEGHIEYWDIENQKWYRDSYKYALKSLNNSSNICSDFLNEIKSHLQIHLDFIVPCFGITKDPSNKEFMMVLFYCKTGNLRNYLNKSKDYVNYKSKIDKLQHITRGLLDIHNAEKVHKDFHSGNILLDRCFPYISDLGMCQPVNIKQSVNEEGIYGVLPYMAPEVLRGYQYTKAADVYSFGIIMNEFLSEEIPFNDIPHDEFLAIKICKGFRPTISKDVPKLFTDLIIKCWDAEIKNRPTTKELYQILTKWYDEIIAVKDSEDAKDSENGDNSQTNEDGEDGEDSENGNNSQNSEIYFQIKECDKIREEKFKNRSNEDKSKSFQTHPQAFYTSRLLNFKNLPNPVNTSDLSDLSFFQFSSDANYIAQSTSDPISECLDCLIK
ncbi:kinase-like domain-containing protein [Rhizophagus irregularis DAOM 181602=DAOM 197198]|uniref:Kinase-like domain-containing protein n=1 Tax=Rhizophagus irregularis (strain DAOM 181602 / DAOM 197198 / MUCL 43194) TaxID=747089 RepID=A0A2H5RNP2_RHIID|nr:kinase-like domain-containing protein [Rhizophagus irregularis DAOM 181602=DAOM 197198]POG58351.1 kinase-like domain-containing protein [Rhizophagus irregularis DAOM 181602=DAOM 197198]|eukprot:XP_025165217.1 kinase-like domain-containing protein [Rhizophagus irregularis DAOM 181602=DAOM 197198]